MKDKILKEIVDNCCSLMECVTIKDNFSEFYKAFEIVKKELDNYYIREIVINNYPNLIISNCLDKDLDIIFCGHIDVVPNNNYFGFIKDGKLFGRGSFDMKGQLSVLISLLKNNKSLKKIALIITSDEEIGGYCCKKILEEYSSKLAVIPDAGNNFNLVVEEKGLLQVELLVKGISYHASEPEKGNNAIVKAMNIYDELVLLYKRDNDFHTSVNLSKINGGSATNMVADTCSMVLDIRYTKDFTKDKIISDIKNIDSDVVINILDYGPTFYVDDNLEVISNFKKSYLDIVGEELKISKCVATCDGIYFSEKNIPCILINPIGNYWHNPKEYVEIDSLYTLYLLFKSLM